MIKDTNTMNEPTPREIDESIYSDIHKDAYGFRPRNYEEIASWSDEKLREEIEYCEKLAQAEAELERGYELANLETMQNRLTKLAAEFNVDVATALRWEMDAEGEHNLEYYLADQGIGFGANMLLAKQWLNEHGVEVNYVG